MRVLVGCEFSAIVRDAFAAVGHDAWSCDLIASERGGQHYQCDVREVLGLGWDLGIFHPPCTYLAKSGERWLYEREGRWELMREAAAFFLQLYQAPIPQIAIENPRPHTHALKIIGPYTQKVQPWYFGDEQKKGICLWLKNLPPLFSTLITYPPRSGTEAVRKWERVWRMGLSGEARSKERSRFFEGVARAMAQQWT